MISEFLNHAHHWQGRSPPNARTLGMMLPHPKKVLSQGLRLFSMHYLINEPLINVMMRQSPICIACCEVEVKEPESGEDISPQVIIISGIKVKAQLNTLKNAYHFNYNVCQLF